MELLKSLIIVSQKAANIARVCRKDEHLFDLLVQKKLDDEANPRFVQDFKTLADVLIQEMVKHDIATKVSYFLSQTSKQAVVAGVVLKVLVRNLEYFEY